MRARDGAGVSMDEMKEAGLSPREARELMEKLRAPSIPEFDLDVSRLVDADMIPACQRAQMFCSIA